MIDSLDGRRLATLATAVALAWAPAAAQGDSLRKERNLEKLGGFVGKWDVESTTLDAGRRTTRSGSASFRWLPGEIWLQEELELTGGGADPTFQSCKTTWDSGSGHYVRHGTDNRATSTFSMSGRWTDSRTLQFDGVVERNGRTVHQRVIFVQLSRDELRNEVHESSDGTEYSKRAEARYTRASDKPRAVWLLPL